METNNVAIENGVELRLRLIMRTQRRRNVQQFHLRICGTHFHLENDIQDFWGLLKVCITCLCITLQHLHALHACSVQSTLNVRPGVAHMILRKLESNNHPGECLENSSLELSRNNLRNINGTILLCGVLEPLAVNVLCRFYRKFQVTAVNVLARVFSKISGHSGQRFVSILSTISGHCGQRFGSIFLEIFRSLRSMF